MRGLGARAMVVGALLCVGGLAATAIGASVAELNHGGTYIVFTGAIIFGAIQFFRGLVMVIANR